MTEPTAPTTTKQPTFEEATTLAAATLAEARACAGMDAAPRLVSVADSYLILAQILDRRERGLE
ncbi:hypothetical protein ABZ234_03700 [Nocardiopsis sp. NPDC006198]|uniref:hypothetical protein n=1 Tax=Nocardiopsis sp. NPDC006198 TaxID=3154472 RepID=UPI0033AFAE31